MQRSLFLGAALSSAALGLVGVLACGDLVIPSNSSDNGDDSSTDDGGSSGDDVSVEARPPPDCDAGAYPVALACTGLYTDWTQLTLAPDVQAFTPGATMWADGADSSRWIWLPPGSKIGTSDPNNWRFPVGTKIWQELRLLGKRVETRFLWKEDAQNWYRATFVWNADQSAAPALTIGVPNAMGLAYEVPPVSACGTCHGGAGDFVLGFEEVSLALPKSSGLNLQALEQRGLLDHPPAVAPTVPGGDANTLGALAFLHANCGTSCHNRNPDAPGGATGLLLKLTVDAQGALPSSVQQTDTWTTAYQVPSSLSPYGVEAGGFWRLAPGDPAHSSLLWTASRRDGVTQMPPLATHLVDEDDVKVLSNWITALPH
jgi:hypothetical protein